MDFTTRPHEVHADACNSYNPVEAVHKEEQKSVFVNAGVLDEVKAAILDSQSTLPYFAELYGLSASLRDYILVPTVIMPSDLPNRNCVAFPKEELLRATRETGRLAFQTWVNAIAAADHKNSTIPDHAKGIVFGTFIRPMQKAKGDLVKVIALLGFDRTRDPILANKILTGERKAYSMGAMCSHYTCSICGTHHPDSTCEHVTFRKPEFKTFNNQLAYLKARNFVGFEVSSVEVPAYVSAQTPHFMKMF